MQYCLRFSIKSPTLPNYLNYLSLYSCLLASNPAQMTLAKIYSESMVKFNIPSPQAGCFPFEDNCEAAVLFQRSANYSWNLLLSFFR